MDIKEIRKKIRSVILTAIDWAEKEGMTDGYLDLHIDEILNTEIVPERECPDCNGIGADMSFTFNPIEMPDGRDCPRCTGTGKVTVTVEQAIKEKLDGHAMR